VTVYFTNHCSHKVSAGIVVEDVQDGRWHHHAVRLAEPRRGAGRRPGQMIAVSVAVTPTATGVFYDVNVIAPTH
jgi:hypothetical protein